MFNGKVTPYQLMGRLVITAKLGSNGASMAWRDVETGRVGSMRIDGHPEEVQRILKILEAHPDVEIKYE